MADAVIKAARITAAHDGVAELVLELSYDNGGVDEVVLDELAARTLMQNCQARSVDDLKGHGWQAVREALQVSWNRYQ